MSTPKPLASPALPATSNTSSFVILSNTHSSSAPRSDDSDDEIIYSVSEDSSLSAEESLDSAVTSDNDFVVLSRPRSQRSILETVLPTLDHDDDARANTPAITDLTTGLATLSVAQSVPRRRRQKPQAEQVAIAPTGAVAKKKKKKAKKSQPSPVNTAVLSPVPSPARSKRIRSKRSATPTTTPTTSIVTENSEKQNVVKAKSEVNKEKSAGFGGRSIVDDVSDKFSDYGESDVGSPSMHEEAFGFITSYVTFRVPLLILQSLHRFLSNPAARQDSACRLTLLQALIIELGLATSSLPSSLTAAKAYLKSRAFLNIREYIAVRDQGPAAVQRIMYPSRSALIKAIRKNKKNASLKWVKESGLQVLLVQCYH
ncbi:hypothetical protein J132_02771 [Termitomyces sp. J132]|nr:hypothetical protein J132_02771 [Termitomyces sp. J132]